MPSAGEASWCAECDLPHASALPRIVAADESSWNHVFNVLHGLADEAHQDEESAEHSIVDLGNEARQLQCCVRAATSRTDCSRRECFFDDGVIGCVTACRPRAAC